MQLLHDTNLDLYIVLTRYGRIGEMGMNQRSPFNKIENAIADFHSIFKSKTGNEFTDLGNFEKQKKKYSIVQVTYSSVKNQDYLAPFDYNNCAPTAIQNKSVYELIEEISNVTMFQKAMQACGIDNDIMPISSLKKEVVNEGLAILWELDEVVKAIDVLRQAGLRASIEEIDDVKSKAASLTSKFYALIPFSEGKNEIT